MSATNGRVIDLHAHIVLEEGFGVAGRYGPELAVDADGVSFSASAPTG